jgi:HTH-type transcriptional regulator/antitoxin HigA
MIGSALLERMQNMIRLTLMKFKSYEIKPIKNRKDYNQALERLEIIFDSKLSSAEEAMNLKY